MSGGRKVGARVVLLAHPAGHSLSPLMQNAAFAAAGVDAEYEALDVAPADLERAVARLRHAPFLGANVTVPHKEAAARLVDELSPAARAVGAVNTIVRRGDALWGHNTDGEGFMKALDELGVGPAGSNCVVLGGGGSARAVVHALVAAGARVSVVNRNEERALRLVEELAASRDAGNRLQAVPRSGLLYAAGLLESSDLLVNCTSVGMAGGPDPTGLPLLPAAALGRMPVGAAVVDLVYRPAVTPLLAAAAAAGLKTQNGLPMLVWQGALAFEAWTGRRAPVTHMRAAAERGLADSVG